MNFPFQWPKKPALFVTAQPTMYDIVDRLSIATKKTGAKDNGWSRPYVRAAAEIRQPASYEMSTNEYLLLAIDISRGLSRKPKLSIVHPDGERLPQDHPSMLKREQHYNAVWTCLITALCLERSYYDRISFDWKNGVLHIHDKQAYDAFLAISDKFFDELKKQLEAEDK